MTRVRFIGDVHGKSEEYLKLVERAERERLSTLQVGDMGFSYDHLQGVCCDHRFIAGNHDNYTILLDEEKCPDHCIGDYGLYHVEEWEYSPLFYVRGAYSVDRMTGGQLNQRQVEENKKRREEGKLIIPFAVPRTEGVDWWHEEELTMGQCYEALNLYTEAKPRVVVSHDCPDSMRDWFYSKGFTWSPKKTRTGQLLQAMYEAHEPEFWIFGHWHRNVYVRMGCTLFVCVGELSTYTL